MGSRSLRNDNEEEKLAGCAGVLTQGECCTRREIPRLAELRSLRNDKRKREMQIPRLRHRNPDRVAKSAALGMTARHWTTSTSALPRLLFVRGSPRFPRGEFVTEREIPRSLKTAALRDDRRILGRWVSRWLKTCRRVFSASIFVGKKSEPPGMTNKKETVR